MKLQEWANKNKPSEDMIYKDGYWKQIVFIRDNIPAIFSNTYDEYKQIQDDIIVISDHTSKSVKLPVFKVMLPNGIILIIRYNFHDWKVSVMSKMHIVEIDHKRLFDQDAEGAGVYFEGFEDEWVFGAYSKNKNKFSVEITSGYYKIFTFLFLLAKNIK